MTPEIDAEEGAQEAEVQKAGSDRHQTDGGDDIAPWRLEKVQGKPDDDDARDDPKQATRNAEHEADEAH